MMQEVIWYETKQVEKSVCLECRLGITAPGEARFNLMKQFIDDYEQGGEPLLFCLGCGRFVLYRHNDLDPGCWQEINKTDDFRGVV